MNIDYNGDTFTFDIPDHYKKIGIGCSGGADSSILLYMLINYLEKNNLDKEILVLTQANKKKSYLNALSATNVVDYMLKLTDKIKSHHVYYFDVQKPEQLGKIYSSFNQTGEMDLALTGLTSNPLTPAIVKNALGVTKDLIKTGMTERSGSSTKRTFYDGSKYHEYLPFKNMDKKFIAFLYDYYSVTELFPLTRSCEQYYLGGIPTGMQIEEYTADAHCGNCWWCLERKWAFGKL